MENIAVQITDLHKSFDRIKVLKGLNLSVEKGSVLAFLGRNGEGKTTTMKILMNIHRADSGSVRILGENPETSPQLVKLKTGYVPETPFYYNWMTISQIFSLVADSYGALWDSKRVADLCGTLGLDPEKQFGSLSMGTKTKVSLVAALGHNPELLLLDDPTSGLDAVVRRQFLETLMELVDKTRCTVIFSSHIIADMERIADRVCLLHNGILTLDTDLQELKERTRLVSFATDNDAGEKLAESLKKKAVSWKTDDNRAQCVLSNISREDIAEIEKIEGIRLQLSEMSLEDIFIASSEQDEEEGSI